MQILLCGDLLCFALLCFNLFCSSVGYVYPTICPVALYPHERRHARYQQTNAKPRFLPIYRYYKHISIQPLQPLVISLTLRHHNPNQTALQHVLPIDPRMHLDKQPRAILASPSQQLPLATGMERQIRTDVVHLPLINTPRRHALATIVFLELRGSDARECGDAAEIRVAG